jgi:hypothetical protein
MLIWLFINFKIIRATHESRVHLAGDHDEERIGFCTIHVNYARFLRGKSPYFIGKYLCVSMATSAFLPADVAQFHILVQFNPHEITRIINWGNYSREKIASK